MRKMGAFFCVALNFVSVEVTNMMTSVQRFLYFCIKKSHFLKIQSVRTNKKPFSGFFLNSIFAVL